MRKNNFGGINLTVPTNVLEIKSLSNNQKIIWAIIIISLITSIYFLFRKASFSTFGEISLITAPICAGIPHTIMNGTSNNMCLRVKDGFLNNGAVGTPVVLGKCLNGMTSNPDFMFRKNNNQIVWNNDGSIKDKCLQSVPGSGNLKLGNCIGEQSSDPSFQFKSNDNGTISYINNGNRPNECISVPSNARTVGTEATVRQCNSMGYNFEFKYNREGEARIQAAERAAAAAATAKLSSIFGIFKNLGTKTAAPVASPVASVKKFFSSW